jgi:hypothetical protein
MGELSKRLYRRSVKGVRFFSWIISLFITFITLKDLITERISSPIHPFKIYFKSFFTDMKKKLHGEEFCKSLAHDFRGNLSIKNIDFSEVL